jgi:DNA invertase Pin-like site-specific DNA recombinase
MNYWWDTHAYQQQQDLTAQRDGLHPLGVGDDRIYVDHGLTGTNRDRPGLRLALAACRAGDTLVVTKLDRLARSLPDARDILDELTKRNVKLSLGGSIHDPTDPVGRLLFNVLAMVAEFESDPDPTTHPGRDESSQGQGSAARQAAQAEAEPGQTPAGAARLGELHPSRAGRALRRRAIHDLPDHRADATQATQNRSGHSHISPIPKSEPPPAGCRTLASDVECGEEGARLATPRHVSCGTAFGGGNEAGRSYRDDTLRSR